MRALRIPGTRAAAGLGLAILLTAVFLRALGPLNAGLARATQTFHPTPPVSFVDSLPALEGLQGLEAFSVLLPPGTLANPNRSLWLSDSLDTLAFNFHSDRLPFDSARVYLWDGSSLRHRLVRERGTFSWKVPARRNISGWAEVVGLYVSYPPLFRMRVAEGSVELFERAEGVVLHVLRNAYARPRGTTALPDTTYPAIGSEELTLLARGRALAAVNGSARSVRLGMLGVQGKSPAFLNLPARTASVYRNLLQDTGTVLAYTAAGEPLCFLGRCRETAREFFHLERRAPHAPQ